MITDTVTWRSTAFNTTRALSYFINPECYGDDAAQWLISRLRELGVDTDPEPTQEDFGWFFEFRVADADHCFILGHRPDPGGQALWIGFIESGGGLIASLRNRNKLHSRARELIHRSLSSSPEISEVRWHEKHEFDGGIEDGYATPIGGEP